MYVQWKIVCVISICMQSRLHSLLGSTSHPVRLQGDSNSAKWLGADEALSAAVACAGSFKKKCCFTNKGLSCVKYTVHVVIFLEMLSAHTSTVFIGCVHYFHQVEILKPIPSVSSKFGHRCEKK